LRKDILCMKTMSKKGGIERRRSVGEEPNFLLEIDYWEKEAARVLLVKKGGGGGESGRCHVLVRTRGDRRNSGALRRTKT